MVVVVAIIVVMVVIVMVWMMVVVLVMAWMVMAQTFAYGIGANMITFGKSPKGVYIDDGGRGR